MTDGPPGEMILSEFILALLWITVVLRVPTVWRDRRQRAIFAAVLALALTKTTAFPPIAARLDMPVLPHLFGVFGAFCLLRFVSLATGSTRRTWQFALTAGVLATLGVLQVAAGGIDTSADVLQHRLYPAAVGYWVVLEAYLGAVLITAAVLFWTVARAAPAGLTRLGLRTVAAGLSIIAGYAALETALIVVHGFGVPVGFAAMEPVVHVVQSVAVLLVVAGGTVPAYRQARTLLAAYRALLVLRPLWRAMRDAFPEVILFSPRRAVVELAGVDDVRLRLYRRVIEIRDGMLALRDFVPDDVPAAGDPAVTEARAIAGALRRRAGGADPGGRIGAWATVGPDMPDEVAWLSRVSTAFRRLATEPVTPGGVPTPRPSGSAR